MNRYVVFDYNGLDLTFKLSEVTVRQLEAIANSGLEVIGYIYE